jgi:hypothetical protein
MRITYYKPKAEAKGRTHKGWVGMLRRKAALLPMSVLVGQDQDSDDNPRSNAWHDHGWHKGWYKHHEDDDHGEHEHHHHWTTAKQTRTIPSESAIMMTAMTAGWCRIGGPPIRATRTVTTATW